MTYLKIDTLSLFLKFLFYIFTEKAVKENHLKIDTMNLTWN